MRICIVNSFYYPDIIGGAELSVLKLAEQLEKNGHEVHILCTGTKNKIEIINKVIVHRIKIKNICDPITKIKNQNINQLTKWIYSLIDTYNVFNYAYLKNILLEINPDVIHINNINGISMAIWSAAKSNKIPVVQTLRDYSLLKDGDGVLDKIRNPIYRNLSTKVNYVTAPSYYTLNKFKNRNYFKGLKNKVVYNAIDYSEENVKKELEYKIKRCKSNEKVRFVFLGRLEVGKGIKFLIEAFKEINNKNIELIIAGDGECKEYVINETINDERIKYKGFLNEEEVNVLLHNSDVLVIPSLWPEPFGRVVIEAYKYSMPVIGCISGGIPEIINEKTGACIQPGDHEGLKTEIEYFSCRENIYKKIAACSNEVRKYDIKVQTKEFTLIYESLVNK